MLTSPAEHSALIQDTVSCTTPCIHSFLKSVKTPPETERKQTRNRQDHEANGWFFPPCAYGQSRKTSPYLLNKNGLAMNLFGKGVRAQLGFSLIAFLTAISPAGRTQPRDEHLIERNQEDCWTTQWSLRAKCHKEKGTSSRGGGGGGGESFQETVSNLGIPLCMALRMKDVSSSSFLLFPSSLYHFLPSCTQHLLSI